MKDDDEIEQEFDELLEGSTLNSPAAQHIRGLTSERVYQSFSLRPDGATGMHLSRMIMDEIPDFLALMAQTERDLAEVPESEQLEQLDKILSDAGYRRDPETGTIVRVGS